MNTLLDTLQRQPVLAVHLVSALGALVLGAVMFIGRKGSTAHRVLGWTWVVLMGSAALSSVFLSGDTMPHVYGLGPIHLLTLLTLVMLPLGVLRARRGQVQAHRKTMRGLYVGGCLVAGAFTLMPGRLLGQWLWGALA